MDGSRSPGVPLRVPGFQREAVHIEVRRVHLTFPQDQVGEPVIWALGREFHVVTNVRRANISDGAGWMALDLEGEPAQIEGAIAYLKARGIEVEPILEEDTSGR